MSLSEEISPGLCRYLNCNGIHDQGHKLSNDIVDVQFVELKANIPEFHALTLCYGKRSWPSKKKTSTIHYISQHMDTPHIFHLAQKIGCELCHNTRSPKTKTLVSNAHTWYIKTTIMGNSANTFRERDPLGMMECWKREASRATVITMGRNTAHH